MHFLTQVIKLGDLGIAKQLEGTLELAITCLGTPLYMWVRLLSGCWHVYPGCMLGLN
jgi:hypothetical protein